MTNNLELNKMIRAFELLYWKLYEWWALAPIIPPERGVLRVNEYSLVTFPKPSRLTHYFTMVSVPSQCYSDPYTNGRIDIGSSVNAMWTTKKYDLIINATLEVPNFSHEESVFLRVPVRDVEGANIFFNEAHALHIILQIHNAMCNGQKVFVHCFAGASRSVSIVITYLLWRYRQQYDILSVYEMLHRKRSIVAVNSNFLSEIQCLIPKLDRFTHKIIRKA